MASGATCIAYETVTSSNGGLPLLTPMSEVAGRLAPQVGAHALEKARADAACCSAACPASRRRCRHSRRRRLGHHAATIAVGMGANVTVVDRSPRSAARLSAQFGAPCIRSIRPAPRSPNSSSAPICHRRGAGAGRRGAQADHARDARDDEAGRSDRRHRDRPGRLLRDLRATTHAEPTYVVDGVVHYCVANMPGASRAPPPLRSTTRRCRSRSRSPTRGGNGRLRKIRICRRAQRARRQAHVRARRRGAWVALYAGGERAGLRLAVRLRCGRWPHPAPNAIPN